LCQPTSGLEIELPEALEDQDEQDDQENNRSRPPPMYILASFSVVCDEVESA
jgi:hypothetical protein